MFKHDNTNPTTQARKSSVGGCVAQFRTSRALRGRGGRLRGTSTSARQGRPEYNGGARAASFFCQARLLAAAVLKMRFAPGQPFPSAVAVGECASVICPEENHFVQQPPPPPPLSHRHIQNGGGETKSLSLSRAR